MLKHSIKSLLHNLTQKLRFSINFTKIVSVY